MKFELINPSDEIWFEARDPRIAALAALQVGNGKYGAISEHGESAIGLVAFGGFETWVKDTFGGEEAMNDFVSKNRREIAECLLTFKTARERSSMNDICGYAHGIAKKIITALEKENGGTPAAHS